MLTENAGKARAYFAARMVFTTGPFEIQGMLARKENVTIVDVRATDDYAKSHIPAAVNLPQGQWHTAEGLSKDTFNILYCYSQTCHLAAAAAVELASQGYRVIRRLDRRLP